MHESPATPQRIMQHTIVIWKLFSDDVYFQQAVHQFSGALRATFYSPVLQSAIRTRRKAQWRQNCASSLSLLAPQYNALARYSIVTSRFFKGSVCLGGQDGIALAGSARRVLGSHRFVSRCMNVRVLLIACSAVPHQIVCACAAPPRPAGCTRCCFECRLTPGVHGWCLWHSLQ